MRIWKSVQGFEQYYKISNYGEVLSLRTDKIMIGDKDPRGYIRVTLSGDNLKMRYKVHRLVAYHFLTKSSSSFDIVNHKDFNPSNNNASNLEWTSTKGNINHAKEAGKLIAPVGSKNGMSVLTEYNVIDIIEAWNSGDSKRKIANDFNISFSCVAHIIQGDRWKHFSHLIIRKSRGKKNAKFLSKGS